MPYINRGTTIAFSYLLRYRNVGGLRDTVKRCGIEGIFRAISQSR